MKHLILAVGLLTSASGTALAQMGPRGPELEGLDHSHLMMLMRVAKLTDDQKMQAHQIMKDARESSKPMLKQIRALKDQVAEKMVAPGPLQLSDLNALRQQIRELQIQVDDEALGAMIKVHNLLKPDQMQRLVEAHAKFKSLHQQLEELSGPPDEGPEGDGPR